MHKGLINDIIFHMVTVIFATGPEMEPFIGMIGRAEAWEAAGKPLVRGKIGKKNVAAYVTGIGQANTAASLAYAFCGKMPEMVIMGGCAGAYPGSGLSVGDAAAATEETYPELGVLTADGMQGLEAAGLPLVETDGGNWFGSFPVFADEGLLEAAAKDAGVTLARGRFLTVSAVSGTAKRGMELRERFGAVAENMEGAAAAQVCLARGVPFMEIRGISNMVEDRDRGGWRVAEAAEASALAIKAVIERL